MTPRETKSSSSGEGAGVEQAAPVLHDPLLKRIREWREDDKQGYDTAIELLCEAEAQLAATEQARDEATRQLAFHSSTALLERCREDHRRRLGQQEPSAIPGMYQLPWRQQPPFYDRSRSELAVVDALIEQGGIAAWSGDGVGCVAQMIDAQAERATRAEQQAAEADARLQQLRAALLMYGRHKSGCLHNSLLQIQHCSCGLQALLDAARTVKKEPVRCSGCGARWSVPEGFIFNGVVHLCGDCWREIQRILHNQENPERHEEAGN